jgi:hypothetical protein
MQAPFIVFDHIKAKSESPYGPRSDQPTDHPNRSKDRAHDEVVLNIGQPIDTVADVKYKRDQKRGSDEPAKLGHTLEGTASRRALQGFDRR